MAIPEWADGQLSKALPELLSQGENQGLEYIETFPKNARELGKGSLVQIQWLAFS